MRFDWLARLDEIYPRTGAYIKPLSPEWWQARRGRLTASGAAYPLKVYGQKGITGLAKKLRGQLQDDWTPKELKLAALEWGREWEAPALAAIELATGAEVVEPGTLFHPEFSFCSSTPDAMIDGHVSVQIKCPHKPGIHLATVYGAPLKPLYANQVQWEAWTSGADQILFCSFDPEQPFATRLYQREIPIDRELFGRFERNVQLFREFFETGVWREPSVAVPVGIPEPF